MKRNTGMERGGSREGGMSSEDHHKDLYPVIFSACCSLTRHTSPSASNTQHRIYLYLLSFPRPLTFLWNIPSSVVPSLQTDQLYKFIMAFRVINCIKSTVVFVAQCDSSLSETGYAIR